ncbi:helix-turn-helix domain-containing protein [Neptunomonas phycophila]|uniref:helix-turn-helix domain-containing protein n=1 Tax=Neptunomonas phycophila TaxID=1572645 RepID=UPI000A602185|nr:helix-turn-helix transcriptional regulator [Neptunomonas phycophila]QLE96661.1 helix-turn-helix transcriptional regulator [Neptunomonas phycophila]
MTLNPTTSVHNTEAYGLKALAGLIDHIHSASFPKMLEEFIGRICQFDSFLMLTYKTHFKPLVLHPKSPAEHSPTLRFYIDQAYIFDPIYHLVKESPAADVHRICDIAPDSFHSTEYYEKCYKYFDLVDEINLIIPIDNEVTCAIALGRKSQLGSINRQEHNALKQWLPVLASLVQQFWLTQQSLYIDNAKPEGAIQQALTSFGSGVLTRREQQITALILQGHSSKAISALLDISPGTVKVHRKNIHTRLNTSTQSEIFQQFLTHLKSLDDSIE